MRQTRKQALAIILCLCLLLPLWGCGGQELYERLLIHGIGIDVKGDDFTVTVRSSSAPEDEGEECFVCQGKSVLEAMNSLTLSTGRKPFYSHNYLVVFGRECAEQGLDQCLDFFVRYYNTRPGVQLYLAEDRAEQVLSLQKGGKYQKMWELQQLGDVGRDSGRALGVELLDFINGVKREGSSPMLPVLRTTEESTEIVSTAYFDGCRLKGFLTPDETRGYLAAKGKLKSGEAVVSGSDLGTVTLSLSRGWGEIELGWEDDLPQFCVRVGVQGDLSAVDRNRDRLEDNFYSRTEEELAGLLAGEVKSALQKTLEDGCDVFGFGNLLYQRDPAFWRQNGESWKEWMTRCAYTVEISAEVKRMEQERLPPERK